MVQVTWMGDGRCNGATAISQSSYPKAVYMQYAAHILFRCLIPVSNVQVVKNVMGTNG